VTEDGVTASGYGAENTWEVRAVRYSPVGDTVIPSNAKNVSPDLVFTASFRAICAGVRSGRRRM